MEKEEHLAKLKLEISGGKKEKMKGVYS